MGNFKNKVVYQIYPKSFCDSNGDGVGDLKGITSKLDYLQDLGVELLWCTPFFPSPQRDNGYDISDFCAVDPRFGTMEDLEELIHEADKRNIGLMFDMVFNHTSTQHAWFQKALAGDKKYQDYYIFKDGTLERFSLLYDHYAFIDVPEYFADQLFIQHQVTVHFGNEFQHPDQPYRIIFCKVRKRDRDRFLSALSELNHKMILCGYPGYEGFCTSFIAKMNDGAKALREKRCKSNEAHPSGETEQTRSESAS